MPALDNDWWQRDRHMTAAHFNRTVKAMKITRAGCARFLGVSERTVFRYSRGHRSGPRGLHFEAMGRRQLTSLAVQNAGRHAL